MLFSSTSGGTLDGIRFRDEDVLLFSAARQRFAMFIDGSDIGLAAVDVDAVQARADGSMSTGAAIVASLREQARTVSACQGRGRRK